MHNGGCGSFFKNMHLSNMEVWVYLGVSESDCDRLNLKLKRVCISYILIMVCSIGTYACFCNHIEVPSLLPFLNYYYYYYLIINAELQTIRHWNYLATALYLFSLRATLPIAVFRMAPASPPDALSTFCPFTETSRSPFIILPSISADPPFSYNKIINYTGRVNTNREVYMSSSFRCANLNCQRCRQFTQFKTIHKKVGTFDIISLLWLWITDYFLTELTLL